MATEIEQKPVLVVGDEATLRKPGMPANVELVDSLAEAVARHASGSYAKIIVDPAALKGVDFEVLADGSAHGLAEEEPGARPQEALRESEERLRSVLDNSADVIYRYNVRTDRFEYISPSCEAVLGYTPNELMALDSEASLEMVHPDDREAVRAKMALLGERDEVRLEYRQRTKRGDYRWISNHAILTRDGIGQPLHRNGSIRDITELKQTEEALRQSEARYRTLHESLRDAFVQVDMDGRIVEFNDVYCQMLGYSAEELRKLTYRDLTPEHWHAFEERILQEQIIPRGYSDVYEKEYRRKDGTVFPVELRTVLWRDECGRPIAMWGIIRDITERKQAEQAAIEARRSAERRAAELEAVMDAAPVGLMITRDPEGRYITGNRAAHEILRVPLEESNISKSVPDPRGLRSYKPMRGGKEVPPNGLPIQMAVKGQEVRDSEYDIVFDDGEVRHLVVNACPLCDEDGNPRGAVGAFLDITYRRYAEQEREELLRRERHIAETLQQALVPPEVPARVGDCSFHVVYQPCLREAEVGGDFYDVFDMGEGKVGVLIGDVAGKGLAAAVHVSSVRYAVRGYAFLDPRPGRVLALVNEAVCKDAASETRMLTAFFAVIDTRLGTMVYANAGHEPPVAVRKDGQWEELLPTGVPLGIYPDMPYAEGSIRLDQYEMVVMMTDGIVEARSSTVELFGKPRVIDFLIESIGKPPPVTATGLVAVAMEHADGPLQDDAAVVIVAMSN